ncbi:MAG: flavin-containing monooxygenase [Gemmatimonadota bacterium]
MPRATQLVIVGGGFSGIGMAIRLRQRGIDDFVVLERARDLGGTWRDNSYPGCACDVQSTLYSFSFAPNPDWSRTFSPQGEIWDYLRRCARDFDVERHFAFGEEVSAAGWSDADQAWRITSTSGEWRAPVMIMATGPLSESALPAIVGLERFAGRVFHSARWNHEYSLRGKRVAVIGTGASAIQFVPKIQPLVERLHVYQRTPPWIMPRRDRAVPAWRRALYRRLPAAQRAERAALYALREAMFLPFRHPGVARVVESIARRHLAAQVEDPTLRSRLTPAYRIGCKRILPSDDYYPAIAMPNVELVTERIARVTAGGIVTADGAERAADAIILGTGFRATDPPIAPFVRNGAGRSLADAWRGSPKAYMGTTMAGFPNLFFLLGPNTGLGHSSVMLMVEAQFEHVLGVLALMRRRGAAAIEPSADAQERYVARIDARLAPTVWNRGGCKSWYLDATGRNSTLWPDGVGRFRRTVATVVEGDYVTTPPTPQRAVRSEALRA